MPTVQGQDQTPEKDTAQTRGSRTSDGSSERDYWRDCEPHPYCGPTRPYWDPCCGPPPHHWRHPHHQRRHHRWPTPPMPGSEFFEAMINFAASAAGSRGRLWQGMADAARYARRDYMCDDPCYDPCYDPCGPYPSYCDPCAPPQPYCDPCATPWSYCDPCAPQQVRPGCEEWDLVDIKGLRETLEGFAKQKLQKLADEVDGVDGAAAKAEKLKEYETAKAKAEAANDAIIHAVKLARVAEAMRKKQWSRGPGHQRGY
jgi:hypothetical protein